MEVKGKQPPALVIVHLMQQNAVLMNALRKIRDIDVSDTEEYVRQADTIACDAITEHDVADCMFECRAEK